MPKKPNPDEVERPVRQPPEPEIAAPASVTHVAETAPSSRQGVIALAAMRQHRGPLPDAEYFRELQAVHPDAPRIIIEDFQEQAKHRRAMEQLVIEASIKNTNRGQTFGFTLGLVGVVGSLVVIALGHPTAGTLVASSCVVSLVVVFVLGRESQKSERIRKEELRQQIGRGDSIEDLETDSTDQATESQSERP